MNDMIMVEILKDFYIFKKGEKVEITKDFAELVINKGFAKLTTGRTFKK